MLFLQIGAHDPLQTNKPKQTLTSECARTHAVMSQQDSLKRWDFKDDLKDMNVFDDLTLQGKLFQTQCSIYEKDLWPGECMQKVGTQRMEVSKKSIASVLVCELSVQSSRWEQ